MKPDQCISHSEKSDKCISHSVKSDQCISHSEKSDQCISHSEKSDKCISHSLKSDQCISHSEKSDKCISHSVKSDQCVSHPVKADQCISHLVKWGEYLPLSKVADTPFYVQGDKCLTFTRYFIFLSSWSLLFKFYFVISPQPLQHGDRQGQILTTKVDHRTVRVQIFVAYVFKWTEKNSLGHLWWLQIKKNFSSPWFKQK